VRQPPPHRTWPGPLADSGRDVHKRYRHKGGHRRFNRRSRRARCVACSNETGPERPLAVRILTTLLRPDAVGTTWQDAMSHRPLAVRYRIGLVGQNARGEILSDRQNVVMFGKLYTDQHRGTSAGGYEATRNSRLTAAADQSVAELSGGASPARPGHPA